MRRNRCQLQHWQRVLQRGNPFFDVVGCHTSIAPAQTVQTTVSRKILRTVWLDPLRRHDFPLTTDDWRLTTLPHKYGMAGASTRQCRRPISTGRLRREYHSHSHTYVELFVRQPKGGHHKSILTVNPEPDCAGWNKRWSYLELWQEAWKLKKNFKFYAVFSQVAIELSTSANRTISRL